VVKANLYLSMALSVAVFGSSCWTNNHIINVNVTCTKPIEINGQLEYPCGKCMACRIQRTQEWGVRLMHESYYHENNKFITLTYDENTIPLNGSVKKKHLQDFIKRLRSDLHPDLIKHYSVSEYGEKTDRPHYHSIIFGLPDNEDYEKLIKRNWSYGLIDVGTVTWDSVRYVAGYIQKKLYGKMAEEIYTATGREPPCQLSSQGLGLAWARDNETYLNHNQRITVMGVPCGIPRYYVNKLGLDLTASSERRRTEDEKSLNDYLEKYKITIEDKYDAVLKSKAFKNLNITTKSGQKTKKL